MRPASDAQTRRSDGPRPPDSPARGYGRAGDMEFLILGPLEVRDERGPISLVGAKPRGVLAMLLLHANSLVSAERLAMALWGEEAPARAVKTVQVHVSRLRKALGDPEARVEADLARGLEAELAGELRQLVSEHPTRERLAEQLMLALYRCGRQTEALDAYREARGRLVAEMGVEPGPDLRRLHAAILRQ